MAKREEMPLKIYCQTSKGMQWFTPDEALDLKEVNALKEEVANLKSKVASDKKKIHTLMLKLASAYSIKKPKIESIEEEAEEEKGETKDE